MPSNTSYAQLYLYNNTTDKETLFSEFRERLAGTADTSNMQKIDKLLSQDNDRITNLENSPSILTAKATTSDSGNNFVVTIEGFTEYKQDMIMAIYLSQNNIGLTTININNIGIKSLMKIGDDGTPTNLEANDLKKNVGYLFQYDGTQFVLLQEKTFESLNKKFLTFEEIESIPLPPLPTDSDLLGGIPAEEYLKKIDSPNKNLLVNPLFKYNGRNQNSYDGDRWTVDGWYASSGSTTITLPENVTIINASSIKQPIQNSEQLFSKSATFSVEDSTGTVYSVSATMPESAQNTSSQIASQSTPWGSISIWNSNTGSAFSAIISATSAVTLTAAKLEVGLVSTLAADLATAQDETIEQLRLDMYDLDPGRPAWILTQNENLLDNWYFVGGGSQQGGGQFPINQRGQTSYTGGVYGIDCWRSNRSTTTVTVESNGIKFSDSSTEQGGIRQSIETDLQGKTVTLSLLVASVNGAAYIRVRSDSTFASYGGNFITSPGLVTATATIPSGYPGNLCFYIDGDVGTFSSVSATILAAKLELGTRSTLARLVNGQWVLNDPPPNFQQELAKCQRYLKVITENNANVGPLSGTITGSGSYCWVAIPTDVPMRVSPTVTFSGNVIIRNTTGYAPSGSQTPLVPSSVTVATDEIGYIINLRFVFSEALGINNTPATLSINDGSLILSAEL